MQEKNDYIEMREEEYLAYWLEINANKWRTEDVKDDV